MNNVKKLDLPITFTVVQEFSTEDTRFAKVVIDVLHTGENYNNTSFTKEIVEQKLETIKNTPILGYINSEDVPDFEGHEDKIICTEDRTYKVIYAGHAYGVIPESCNPRWETREDSDGVEREHLLVDGLMWTKFEDAMDIMLRDNIKAQSMELVDCEGIKNSDGCFDITDFKFDGCCILSTTNPAIQPAMVDAKVSLEFSIDNISQEIKKKLMEFQAIDCVSTDTRKENEEMENSTNTAVTTEGEEVMVTSGQPEASIHLSVMQIFKQVESILSVEKITEDDYSYNRYWVEDIIGDEVIVFDRQDKSYYGMKYAVSENVVSVLVDTRVRKIPTYINATSGDTDVFCLPQERIAEFQKCSEELNVIKPQYEHYVALEEAARKQAMEIEKQDVIDSYAATELAETAEFCELVENSKNMGLEEVKIKCATLFTQRKKVVENDVNKTLIGNITDNEEKNISPIRERYGIDLFK